MRTTSLNNADFSYSDLRGTDFGNCDTRTLILTGTQRDHKDPLIDTRGAVDIYLTFVSAGAIAALIAHALHAIKVPHGIAATLSIYTGLLLILYMIVWNFLWLKGKSHSPNRSG